MPGARIFNGSTEGAYLEFAHPGIRCYTDPRYVEVAFTREYFAALRDPAAFRAIDQRIGFDAAILGLNESAPLVAALLASPEWRLAYADPHRAFLVRRGTEAEGAILGSGDRSGRPHLRFYAGDDLSEPVNGRPAIEWVVLLVRTKQRALLREALGQLANAPRVPSVVVQYGLGFGMQERDRESVELSLAMAPNMIARSTEDRAIVDRLLRQARQAIPVPPSGEASD